MNRNQTEGNENEAKEGIEGESGKVAGDKSTKHNDKDEKHGGENGTVLGKINDDARKTAK